MSTALAPTLSVTPVATIWPDIAVVSMFPLIGLTLSAMALSSETISMVFSLLG
jgi:hypothetical protein